MTRSQVKRGMMVCVPLDADVKALQAISCTPGVVGLVGQVVHRKPFGFDENSIRVRFPDMHALITNEWYVPLSELRTINEEKP